MHVRRLLKLDLTVPPAIRTWETEHLPLLRLKRFTDDESRRMRDAGRRFCAILDVLAQPLAEAAVGSPWTAAASDRERAPRLLDNAARQTIDLHVARLSALLTFVACSTLPGLVWRKGARFEHFTLRPTNGDVVVKPWDVAKAACAGNETGALGYSILGQEADAAVGRYFGGRRWSLLQMEQEHLEPRWPSHPS